MTSGFTHWLITRRGTLFKDASPPITSFWLMHRLEKTEHKTVAFDVYMAYPGQYWSRAFEVLHGTLHLWSWGVVGMLTALRMDHLLKRPTAWLKFLRELGSIVVSVLSICAKGVFSR